MRNIFKLDNGNIVAYGYDNPMQCYFLDITDRNVNEDIDGGVIEELSTNRQLLMTTKGRVVSRGDILQRLEELDCPHEENMKLIALDLPS